VVCRLPVSCQHLMIDVFQGHHGDLLPEENRILLAEFYLRHRESTSTILHEYAKRKVENFMAKL